MGFQKVEETNNIRRGFFLGEKQKTNKKSLSFWIVIMKGFGFLFMFLLIGTSVFMYLGYPSNGSSVLNQGMVSLGWRNAMTLIIKRRNLECNTEEDPRTNDQDGAVNLEDYRPIDPVPSSTASIKPGPIQHGIPMMPYIPGGPGPSPPPT